MNMTDNLNQKVLIDELQKLQNKLIKEFKNLYEKRSDTITTNTKLLDMWTNRLMGLQYAIKILNKIITAINNGAETGEAYIYMLMPLEMSAKFYETLENK